MTMTERMCSTDRCGNRTPKYGALCWKHRSWRYARQCVVDGCSNKANGRMCPKHYRRLRATGTTDAPPPGPLRAWEQGNGYRMLSLPDHPLARRGRVYEHRFVLFEALGFGPFACHWCAAPIGWGNMHVDHVDSDRSNNAVRNLVQSCSRCNRSRASHARWGTPFVPGNEEPAA